MSQTEPTYKLPNPNGLREQSRLDIQHQTWLLSFNGSLKAPTLPPTFTPTSVLDVGCGSGTWAISYAQTHPDSCVTAFDINPPIIPSGPHNLTILSHPTNAEEPTHWPNAQYDYIHIRMLQLGIKDWPSLFSTCWNHLTPNGWLEINDSRNPWGAENPAANAETSRFLRFSYLLRQAEATKGIDLAVSDHHVDRLRLQGFTDVAQSMVKWPINGLWPDNEREKQMGIMTGKNFKQFCDYGSVVMQTVLGMDAVRTSEFCAAMLQEVGSDREMCYYIPQTVTIARKPQARFRD